MALKIGIPKEVHDGEKRVAATPETTDGLLKLGFTVAMESGAGDNAHFSDDAYKEEGVEIVEDTKKLWAESDIILKVRAPEPHPTLGVHEAELLHEGTCLISFIWPAQNSDLMERLAARKVTVIAMDSVPRISRAQKLDALSSMANIGGYRAIIEAANHFGRFFTGQITAAGKVPPAKVMVIGAGVAGLAALGAANGLGAIVRAFDTRPEVKEQVESMGAEFLELDFEEEGSGTGGYAKVMSPEFIKAEMDLFARQAMEVDIIVTTALIPGRPAPKLITAGMVESMRDGSVIVDMAAEQGGNCALTEPGQIVVKHGVTLIGITDLPSRLPTQSSQLYGTNLRHMLTDLCKEKDGQINVDMEDDVIRGATVIKDGEITWPPPKPKIPAIAPTQKKEEAVAIPQPKEEKKSSGWGSVLFMLIGAGLLAGLGHVSPPAFLAHFTVFVLACFIGYQVVWNVTPALHTPLMSVTNAISGIIVVGALLQVSGPITSPVTILAAIAILVATINISGGFFVTQRMLRMFQK
ncbi:MAG: Re/Si-specific NAD(P)(+) transhydrogenase subunit alpha [Gammaproteobacteria bacterium]|nr:MAG: Re/Si-specific NAD(P)(+) transhydrogenase subunit alpha [Gammaproteobacteria bacterium]RKZ44664.1 MAG: Re/Si-specific NAD(P)(+) transhydrogenase subunit alpha [Gammaproteobacteria bacterium]RKZ72875.1 MAG: Re/Si-specific NAD(P)(+) transhydrogenase subunit alpha [Gammaproteobacteria bacterium]